MDPQNTLESIQRRGKEIYDNELKSILEPQDNGKYAVIEVDSKKYYISEFLDQALQRAKKDFPDKVFYTVRIGFPGVYSFSKIRSNDYHQWLS